jgi:hypothetical protein
MEIKPDIGQRWIDNEPDNHHEALIFRLMDEVYWASDALLTAIMNMKAAERDQLLETLVRIELEA